MGELQRLLESIHPGATLICSGCRFHRGVWLVEQGFPEKPWLWDEREATKRWVIPDPRKAQ